MMSLIARAPSTLSSSASESPEKKSYGSQSPWSAKAEKDDRTGQPVVDRDVYSARFSRWGDDKAWSSQEWKADESMDDRTGQPVVASWARTHEFQSSFSHEKTKHVVLEEEETHDRTGQPVVCTQRGAMSQQFIIGNDEAELELSLGSRSFLDRVSDQVRKRQKKRSSMNITENDGKHYVIWRKFMSVSLESAIFMEMNYSDNQHSIKNTKDLTMKQMFDISAKLVSEQDEIYGVTTIDWEDYSWKYLSLVMNKSSVFSAQRSTSFQILYCVLVRYTRTTQSNNAWEDRLAWFNSSLEYRDLDRIDGEPMEFEWNISQDSIRCSSVKKSKVYCWDLARHQRISQEGLYSCWCSTTSPVDQETMKKNASQMLNSFFSMQRDLEKDNGHFLVLVQRKSGILSVQIVHKVNGTELPRRWCWNVAKAVFRATSPLEVSSKAKAVENCRYTVVPIWKRLKLFFAQLLL